MEVMELLTQAVEQNAADIFLVPGMPFSYKIGGRIICQGEEKIMPDQMNQMITRIYEIAKNRSMERVLSHGDDDFMPAPLARRRSIQRDLTSQCAKSFCYGFVLFSPLRRIHNFAQQITKKKKNPIAIDSFFFVPSRMNGLSKVHIACAKHAVAGGHPHSFSRGRCHSCHKTDTSIYRMQTPVPHVEESFHAIQANRPGCSTGCNHCRCCQRCY